MTRKKRKGMRRLYVVSWFSFEKIDGSKIDRIVRSSLRELRTK